MKECKQKYQILIRWYNFLQLIFSNGHPDPIDCPKDISRKSIALYYFSNGRPKEEILNRDQKNRTYFKNRFGF